MKILLNGKEDSSFYLDNNFFLLFDLRKIEYIGLEFSYALSNVLSQLNNKDFSGKIEIIIDKSATQIELTSFSILLLISKQNPGVIINFDVWEANEALKAKINSFIFSSNFSASGLHINANNVDLMKQENKISSWKYPSSTFLPVIYIDKDIPQIENSLFDASFFWKGKYGFIDSVADKLFNGYDYFRKVKELKNFDKDIYIYIYMRVFF